jgi:rhamnosyltransferase
MSLVTDTAQARVAVLLPTFNGAEFLREQLDSIFNLEDVKPHVFVNDDGSNDGTSGILLEYTAAGLELVTSRHCGGAAKNFFYLIMTANFDSYDYVCLADQDDIWRPEKLKRAIDTLRDHQLEAYSSDVIALWPDGRQVYVRKSRSLRRFDYLFESGGPGNTFVFTAQTALRLRDFLRSIPADELGRIEMHDWFIYAWCRSNGIPWRIDNFGGLLYRQHDDNVIGASSGVAAIYKRLNYMISGWYGQQIVLQAATIGASNTDDDVARLVRFIKTPDLLGLFFAMRNANECRRSAIEAGALCIYFVLRYTRLAKFFLA